MDTNPYVDVPIIHLKAGHVAKSVNIVISQCGQVMSLWAFEDSFENRDRVMYWARQSPGFEAGDAFLEVFDINDVLLDVEHVVLQN